MADHWVRLGMALAIIALGSIGMYQLSTRARAVEPSFTSIGARGHAADGRASQSDGTRLIFKN
jgi:hypothetical protein